MKKVRRIWIISDGVPGHFNQSRGVLMVLSRQACCEVTWIEVRLRVGIYRRILTWLLNATNSSMPLGVLKWFYKVSALPSEKPDLLIGAGGKASFALAFMSRALMVPCVFSGSLRGLHARHFALILSINPNHAEANTLILDVAPMPIDLDAQRDAGKILRGRLGLGDQRVWLLLVGGDGAGYKYDVEDWRNLADQVAVIAKQEGIQWLVSTSRRSGVEADNVLRACIPEQYIADAVWWSIDPRPELQAYFGAAEVVICTEDSLSMMSEAIMSGSKVFAWAPGDSQPNTDYREALDRLEHRKLLVRVQRATSCVDFLHKEDVAMSKESVLADRLLSLLVE